MVAVVFHLFSGGGVAQTPQSYPLVCRGNANLPIGTAPGEGNFGFVFTRGTKPASQGLAPGECSWVDRGMYPQEPDRLSQHVEPNSPSLRGNLTPENRWYEELHSSEKYWTFQAYNNGNGQLIVTGARPGRPGELEVSPAATLRPGTAEIRRPDQIITRQQTLPLDPLTSEEKLIAERIARADSHVGELLGTGRQRLIYVEFLALKPDDEQKTRETPGRPIQIGRHAEVLLYRYDGDLGVRALVDLENRTVKEASRVDGDQVPLTSEDVAEALELALQNEQLRTKLGPEAQQYRVEGERYRVEGMRILATDESDPCWKHRCLDLLFRRGQFYLAEFPVTVDLTARTVRLERRAQ